VVEQRRVETTVTDPDTGQLKCCTAWRTRAWTDTEVVHWPDVPEEDIKDDFEWPAPTRTPHKVGTCPVVWLQNTRSTASPDGKPDCEGCWHLLDQIDRLESRICKAVASNLTPQLILKESERFRRRNPIVQKGANTVISITPEGDASYLEMKGDGIKVAQEEVLGLVDQVLQTAECVIVRPEHAKAYQSGEALQILWRAMESRANRLRVQLEGAIRDLGQIWVRWGQVAGVDSLEDWDWVGVPKGILLPPRKVVTEPEPPKQPKPPVPGTPPKAPEPPEPIVSWDVHVVGQGSYIRLDWPPYWQPTAHQISTVAEGLSKANGAKPFMAQETTTRVFAQYVGQDPEAEVAKMRVQAAEAEAKLATFMAGQPDQPDGEDDPGQEEDPDQEDEPDENSQPDSGPEDQ
jgi:hypothetical protein